MKCKLVVFSESWICSFSHCFFGRFLCDCAAVVLEELEAVHHLMARQQCNVCQWMTEPLFHGVLQVLVRLSPTIGNEHGLIHGLVLQCNGSNLLLLPMASIYWRWRLWREFILYSRNDMPLSSTYRHFSMNHMLVTSSLKRVVLNWLATALIMSGHCKSAAGNVKKNVAIPSWLITANSSYWVFCQYAGDPRTAVVNLYPTVSHLTHELMRTTKTCTVQILDFLEWHSATIVFFWVAAFRHRISRDLFLRVPFLAAFCTKYIQLLLLTQELMRTTAITTTTKWPQKQLQWLHNTPWMSVLVLHLTMHQRAFSLVVATTMLGSMVITL